MARGRAAGYDSQREQIVARAARLFAEQGYSATTMNQLAAACGVSKPALYHYVRDKDRLLVEIAEGHVQRLLELVERVDADAADAAPAPRLRRLIADFLQAYAGAQDAHRVLTEDVKFLPEADRERILDAQRRVVAAFAEAVAEVRPDLRADALLTPVTMLLFGMMNWLFTWFRPGRGLSHAALAPVVADLFLGGLPSVRGVSGPAAAGARATVPPTHKINA